MLSFRNGLLLCTAPMLLAHGAQAQSNSCELLKQTLSARILPEIKGYAMDDVPSKTPVPPGGKVIGTCEGGARKVIFRRFGGPPLTGDSAAGSAPAASAQAATPAPPPRPAPAASAPAPVAQKEAPKPKPEPVVPAKPVAAPVVASPVAKPGVATAPVASAPAPAVVALVSPAPVEKPAEPQPEPPASPTPPVDGDEPGFFGTYGHWLWLLLALPLAAWLWSWVAHRMAYDEAGLPRGPRIRP